MTLTVDLTIYPLELVLRTCHRFTGRCHVVLHTTGNGSMAVELRPRDEHDALHGLEGELANALLDSRLRALIADETRAIRELLVAQAFCEADLLDYRDVESDEYTDPRGIAG